MTRILRTARTRVSAMRARRNAAREAREVEAYEPIPAYHEYDMPQHREQLEHEAPAQHAQQLAAYEHEPHEQPRHEAYGAVVRLARRTQRHIHPQVAL